MRRDKPEHGLGQSTCPDCGKLRYCSKAEAKQAERRMFPRKRSRAYQCGDFWHLATWQPAAKVAFYRGQ